MILFVIFRIKAKAQLARRTVVELFLISMTYLTALSSFKIRKRLSQSLVNGQDILSKEIGGAARTNFSKIMDLRKNM
jgi:hypothetical protein